MKTHSNKISLILLTIFTIFLVYSKSYATNVGGMINVNTTWKLANSPFNLTSDLQVKDGVILTIEPGVEVNGNNNSIVNAGNILAQGTKESDIIFNNVIFGNADNREYALLSFDYCFMNNGSYFDGWLSDGSLEVKNSTLEGPKNLTVYLLGTAFGSDEKVEFIGNKLIDIGMMRINYSSMYSLKILNNLFTGNSGIASSGGTADIRYNSFLNTGMSVVEVVPDFGDDLTAVSNFWNTTNPNVIDSMIFDGNDDLNITGYVSYVPWLTAPHPDTPGIDSDGDGISDHVDNCPTDSNKSEPGICGCGNPDIDGDQDQMMDCWEKLYGLNVYIDDSKEDLDKDGQSNIAEYLDNTIPNDPSSKKMKSMPWISLLLGKTKYDPNEPKSLVIKTSLKEILSDGIDKTIITVDVKPYDSINGIIENGTIVEFNVSSGTALLSSQAVATINGQAKVTLTSVNSGIVSVGVKVKDKMVSGVVNIDVVSGFNTLVSKSRGDSSVVINGYYQPGSSFSLRITNNSSRIFDLTRFEVFNGSSLITYTTSATLLSNGQLEPSESVSLQYTLQDILFNPNIIMTYYLVDQISGKSFIVSE